MSSQHDNAEKMEAMRRWLTRVCDEIGVDAAVLREHEEPLLDLIRDIAHGPSRPGAPLSMFAMGIAVGQGADVAATIAQIEQLVAAEQD